MALHMEKRENRVARIYSRLAELGFVLLHDDSREPKPADIFETSRLVKLDQPSVRAVVGPSMKDTGGYGVYLYQEEDKAKPKDSPQPAKGFRFKFFDKARAVPEKKILKEYAFSDVEFLSLKNVPLCAKVSPAHSQLAQHLYKADSDVFFMVDSLKTTSACVHLEGFYKGHERNGRPDEDKKQTPAYEIGSDEHIGAMVTETLKLYRGHHKVFLGVSTYNDVLTAQMTAPWHKAESRVQSFSFDRYISSAQQNHAQLYQQCQSQLKRKNEGPDNQGL